MTSKHFQRGAVNGATVTMLIAALVLGGLLVSSAVSGYELPFWPAMAVIAVNLLAAGRLAWTVIRAKKQRQAGKP
ncbi:hypothetical protein [Rhodoferax sp.]|uniref:hypothetical protein n=1 Tax=Rhodoferax sp. TaxID=50421 RepID=UPI001A00272D|nr:hypothetical protein [Rhodoferax sp.]MBE0474983.1 hypothetical protein [Rhodoferax sp.]